MDGFGSEIVKLARTRVGLPFKHHFKPNDLCEGGLVTVDACMERGMDNNGYDCSGLVIASLCDVLGITTEQWPREYRHTRQFEALGEVKKPKAGDVLLFFREPLAEKPRRTHIGIFATELTTIHASGISHYVEEGVVEGIFSDIKVILSSVLVGLNPK